MKEKEALSLYKDLKAVVSRIEDSSERDYLAKLIYFDVNFITEGDLTDYIRRNK